MVQKEHALARCYKTKFIASRKTWSAKFQVDVKEEGGVDVKRGTFEYVDRFLKLKLHTRQNCIDKAGKPR